jgi:hypothetical protein
VEEISKRVVSNKERFFASYLNPANLSNPTPEIVDRLLNALSDRFAKEGRFCG